MPALTHPLAAPPQESCVSAQTRRPASSAPSPRGETGAALPLSGWARRGTTGHAAGGTNARRAHARFAPAAAARFPGNRGSGELAGFSRPAAHRGGAGPRRPATPLSLWRAGRGTLLPPALSSRSTAAPGAQRSPRPAAIGRAEPRAPPSLTACAPHVTSCRRTASGIFRARPRKRKSHEVAVPAAPLLPLGGYWLRRRGEAKRSEARRGRLRRSFRPLFPSPRRGLPPRLRHAPRFPEQPARLHLRAVEAERRSDAHHEVGAGREVGRAWGWPGRGGTTRRRYPRGSLPLPRARRGRGAGRSPAGLGPHSPAVRSLGRPVALREKQTTSPGRGRRCLSQ